MRVEGIEPSTPFLSGTCSTTEPHARKFYFINITKKPQKIQRLFCILFFILFRSLMVSTLTHQRRARLQDQCLYTQPKLNRPSPFLAPPIGGWQKRIRLINPRPGSPSRALLRLRPCYRTYRNRVKTRHRVFSASLT